MSWNGSIALTSGAAWSGSPQVITSRQYQSTNTVVNNEILSTGSAIVNVSSKDWANYPAINNVDLSGHYLFNATYLSTLDLQVSSINGSDINIFNSTVNIAGITINNGTVTTTNITNSPAKGGGGGGGNNPTTGGSGNSTWQMINNGVGAVMDTVSKTQQAISGVLNNTGAVLFQTYYAVETAGAVIDLANGAVQLATNAQAMYDTREQNLISGPSGPPGQTSYVYESINGTTQFQFSTLGAPVYSVFRTTDQQFPNKTFGKEIFTSTIIPAGSKVLRSMSDPYQFPLISTIAISTTNYMQSFGQWHAILEPDSNIYTSTLTADTIKSFTLSSGSLIVSSINTNTISSGSALIRNISTNSISTAQITTSSLNVGGGLTFSTLSGYDITRSITSTATLYDSVSSVTQNFLNYQMNLTSSPESFDMGSYFAISPGNETFWSHKQLDFSQTLAGIGLLDITIGSYINGDYFDLKNVGSVNLLVYYSIESNNLLFTLTPGGFYRFTYSSGTNNWTYAANPTQTVQTTNNTFQITQGWDTATISTNNLLIIKAAEVVFPGITTTNTAFVANLTAENGYLSTLFVNTANISTLNVSTSYTLNIIDNTISTTTGIFDTITVSSLFGGFASISTLQVSSFNTVFASISSAKISSFYSGFASISTSQLSSFYSGFASISSAKISSLSASLISTNILNVQNQYTSLITGLPDLSISSTTLNIQATGNPGTGVTQTFSYTGSDQTWTVPANVFFVNVSLTGAAGGFIAGGGSDRSGPGGLVQGNLAVTPGTTYTIIVGQGGSSSAGLGATYGGGATGYYSGGGRTAIALNGNDIATAGGGGGEGAPTSGPSLGGSGGGLVGGIGVAGGSPAGAPGTGGTQNDGGTGGASSYTGSDGTLYAGGAGAINGVGGTSSGGGGGGWYGGGGGGSASSGNGGGGGGGSSYVSNLFVPITNTQGGGAIKGLNGSVTLIYNPTAGVNILSQQLNLYGSLYGIGDVNILGNFIGTTAYLTDSLTAQGTTTLNYLNVSSTTRWGGVGIREFNLLYSDNETAGAGGLQRLGVNATTVTDGGGNKYLSNAWEFSPSLYQCSVNTPYALAEYGLVKNIDSNGYWTLATSLTTATAASLGITLNGAWYINALMIPRQLVQSISSFGSLPPGFVSTTTYGLPIPKIFVSSIYASTVTLQATENMSLLAGGFPVPTYFSTGSITVAGTNQASVLADIVAIGGQIDVDIQANTNNVNIVAGSNITLVASNYLYISSGSYMNTDVYGDMTTDLGGVYTVTSAEVINLNGSNGIGLNSSNAINLTATSNVNINTFTTIQLPGTGSIPSVSPLALTNGNQYDGAQHKSQIEFQFYGGGFNHYISTRHDANVLYGSGNAIDFWLYSVNTKNFY